LVLVLALILRSLRYEAGTVGCRSLRSSLVNWVDRVDFHITAVMVLATDGGV